MLVAMTADGPLNSVENVGDLIKVLDDAGYADSNRAHVRYWFRGHARDNWKLQPGVYRPDFKIDTDKESESFKESESVKERKRLRTEQHLSQDFRVMSAGIRTGNEGNAELYFLQQHYGLPTRLLDWSNIPLAALYFAVSSREHDEANGKLYIMDALQLAGSQDEAKKAAFRGIATSRNPHFQKFLSVLTSWKKPDDFPKFIIPVRPDHFDPRVMLQRGCFTAHPPSHPILTEKHNPTLKCVTIAKDAKPKIRKELALLGMDDFAVYGDMDHLATRLKTAYLRS
jgi:hypothetical protein